MTYKDQFTPHKVSPDGPIIVTEFDVVSDEETNIAYYSAIEYDILFGFDGIIYDARKNSPS